MMLRERRSSCALVVSVIAHAALLATTGLLAAGRLAEAGSGGLSLDGLLRDGRTMVDEAVAVTGWGNTFEVDIDVLTFDEELSPVAAQQVFEDPDDGQPFDKEDEPGPTVPPKPVAKPPETQVQSPAAEPAPKAPQPAASAAPSAEQGAGAGEQKGRGSGRLWGAAGARRGIRPLARDFARAVPAAVSADRAWSKRPVGPVGAIEIALALDDRGAIESVRVPDRAPAALRRLVTRTMALLRAGRFALASSRGAGEEVLRIEVILSQRDPIEGAGVEPHHALNLGHEPPRPGQPGKAYFTLASGRHFEAVITIVSSQARSAAASAPDSSDAGVAADGGTVTQRGGA